MLLEQACRRVYNLADAFIFGQLLWCLWSFWKMFLKKNPYNGILKTIKDNFYDTCEVFENVV